MRLCARSLNNFHVDVMTASTFFTYLSLVIPFHGVNNPEKVNWFVTVNDSEMYLGILLQQLGVIVGSFPWLDLLMAFHWHIEHCIASWPSPKWGCHQVCLVIPHWCLSQSFFFIALSCSLPILVVYLLGEVDIIPISILLIFWCAPYLPFVFLTFLWT